MAIEDKVITISFADNRIPEFKEVMGEDYIKFGADDKYGDDLLRLFNKSSKHNAIVNGKVNYILGGGFQAEVEDEKSKLFLGELKKVDTQTALDVELFGGFYWEIIPKFGGGFTFSHIGFNNMRSNKDNTVFYYKRDWSDRREQRKVYPAFSREQKIPSIFFWKEYRPGCKVYPLPGYVAAINYIEADIEVSKHTLTNAQSGFSASKFINFYNGDPGEEGKRDITNRLEVVSTGAEGKKILIGFNNDPNKKPTIDDLGTSDLTKEDHSHVNDLISGEIFTGHLITHPLLFGVQQPGKLGGATELREAFEIFKNTYVTAKQKALEEIVNLFASLKGLTSQFKLKDVEPIGIEITSDMIKENLSREEIRERLGVKAQEDVTGNSVIIKAINSLSPLVANKVLESMTPDEIRSLVTLPPKPGGNQIAGVDPLAPNPELLSNEEPVNENVKNMTGKQYQQYRRILRDYDKGRTSKARAALELKTSFGFSDEEIEALLQDENPQAFSSDDILISVFEAHGEPSESFEIKGKKAATFGEEDEVFAQSFDDDFLDTQTAPPKTPKKNLKPPTKSFPKFTIRYSYEVRDGEGPEILPTSREFCVRMVSMNKFYSRTDIQKISLLLGYNVFERVGGYWNDGGIIKKHCRHEWKANIVVKK